MPVAPIAQFKKAAASRTHLLLMPVATSKIAEGGRFAGRKAEKGTERFYMLVSFLIIKSTSSTSLNQLNSRGG